MCSRKIHGFDALAASFLHLGQDQTGRRSGDAAIKLKL